MSRATLAVEFLQDNQAATLGELLSVAERVICQMVDFLKDSTSLPVHEAFLRRVARRSARRSPPVVQQGRRTSLMGSPEVP